MKNLPIKSVFGEVFCHESEILERVQKIFQLFFLKKEIKLSGQSGAYGTKIRILRANLKKKKAKELTQKILSSLTTADKNKILQELKLRLSEEGKLFLRFDKQIAFHKEKLQLTDEEDSIQIVFQLEAYPAEAVSWDAVYSSRGLNCGRCRVPGSPFPSKPPGN